MKILKILGILMLVIAVIGIIMTFPWLLFIPLFGLGIVLIGLAINHKNEDKTQ